MSRLGDGGAFRPTADNILAIAGGKVNGWTTLIQRGHNTDLDSGGEEDIWEAGGSLSYLSSEETMNVTSTSTSDDAGQTGALTVLVSGVDGSYDAVSEIVTMDGTSNALTTQAFLRINTLTVLTCGTAGHNVGNITATASSAGTVQCEMDATESLSMNSQFTVPTGKKYYLIRVELNAAKVSGGGTPEIEFRGLARTSATGPWYRLFDKKMDTGVQDELDIEVPVFSAFGAGTDVRLTATSDTDNTEARTRMSILIEDV